jgi:hypothetical protein
MNRLHNLGEERERIWCVRAPGADPQAMPEASSRRGDAAIVVPEALAAPPECCETGSIN